MRKLVTAAVAAAILALATAPVAGANDPKDCSDFSSHAAAQHWFQKHNPRADPAGLDADNDGIACEDL